jgi:hypothetical protein
MLRKNKLDIITVFTLLKIYIMLDNYVYDIFRSNIFVWIFKNYIIIK